jgi:hypothetical protein
MTLYQQGSGPPTAHTEAGRAQELISCLVGVAYAEVVGDARGSVREVRVWTTGQFPTQQTVRNVESALRAHMDVALDRSRIRVMLGDPPPTPDPLSPEAVDEKTDPAVPRRRRWDDRPAEKTMSHAPEGPSELEQPGTPGEQVGSGSSPGAAPSGHRPWAPSAPAAPSPGAARPGAARPGPARPGVFKEPGGGDRIVYDSFEIVHHRTRESVVRVMLEWRGTRFMGQAHGSDDPMSQAEALAHATLAALEALARSHARELPLSLDLLGIQFTDAFEHRLVVVAVEMTMGMETLPVAGSVVVQNGLGLAAVHAVLQATDRRVRALLDPTPESPEPH